MTKYKAVIFDLDGTILDTLQDLADTLNYALLKNGFPCRTIEEVRCFVGNGIRRLIERTLPSDVGESVITQVHADFTQHYSEHCADKTKPYDGIEELLQKLRATGCKTAVVSNKADYAVQLLCRQYFDGSIDVAMGEHDGLRKKPYPDMLNEVLEKLGCHRNEVIYIGDSEVDIQTAQNAGVKSVIVGWGFRDKNFLLTQGAKVFADNVSELESVILEQ